MTYHCQVIHVSIMFSIETGLLCCDNAFNNSMCYSSYALCFQSSAFIVCLVKIWFTCLLTHLPAYLSIYQISEELIRVAILWHELWHEGLEEASRLYFGERNVKGMFAVLEPLHQMMEAGPQTLKETSFQQVNFVYFWVAEISVIS
jgi:FKBP12-rapamycin binding domain